jgi:hypothetical protein
MDKAGRRVLLVVSGIVMFLSLSVIGAYFYVIYEIDSSMEQELSWLPLGDSHLTLDIILSKFLTHCCLIFVSFNQPKSHIMIHKERPAQDFIRNTLGTGSLKVQ